ncbi:hypothetical protein Btru_038917 [Bulinus truncatus]|nr:hypothetical protein Btru_038917 [Bulinus truncatus]
MLIQFIKHAHQICHPLFIFVCQMVQHEGKGIKRRPGYSIRPGYNMKAREQPGDQGTTCRSKAPPSYQPSPKATVAKEDKEERIGGREEEWRWGWG